ncbi:glycoside hydrolase family 28 protein [Paenibacillus alkalitolerans]|uniref:glycoside hydrolase family 28 protein n=1 Tax=Paenibacillus alkalitolerans TaxID=2799335 RepID=UPI001F47292E|nr:glycoside hydrolase family 28 protein [Paenibacillus alkalitolerans]
MSNKAIAENPAELPAIPDRSVAVTEYGAVGNGIHDNTESIQRAIDESASAGGGRVVIPPGIWLTGPLTLKSRIELHAEAGALVVFSKRYTDYPLVMSCYEGRQMFRCQAPLDGDGLEDVAITGGGVFDGGGEAWRPAKKMKLTEKQWNELVRSGGVVDEHGIWWPTQAAKDGAETVARLERTGSKDAKDYESVREFLRPCLLSLRRCKRILLDGPTFQNSASWCLHPWASEHITFRNVTVRNPWYAQNGDGLDIDSCKFVTVEHCYFDVGDDAICLKSGKDEAGRLLGMPSEHITVRHCTVYHGHGGIVVGSEMSGGVKNVHVSDCTFIGTDIGIRFKSCRGRGGVVEQIAIERIRMKDIAGDAISFNLYYEGKSGSGKYGEEIFVPVTVETPEFRNIHIEDIVCDGAQAALLVNGLPEMPVSGLSLKRAVFSCKEGIVCRNGQHVIIEDVELHVQDEPIVTLHQSRSVRLVNLSGTGSPDEDRLLVVTGGKSADIKCLSPATPPSHRKVAISEDANPEEVVVL